MRLTKLIISLLLLTTIICSCTKDKEDENKPTLNKNKELLYGKWKFEGFGTINPESLRTDIEPNVPDKFYIVFSNSNEPLFGDGFYGWTSSNELKGRFDVCGDSDEFCLFKYSTTKVGETPSGYEFADALFEFSIYRKFAVSENKLVLYYEDNKFLQFKRIAL